MARFTPLLALVKGLGFFLGLTEGGGGTLTAAGPPHTPGGLPLTRTPATCPYLQGYV